MLGTKRFEPKQGGFKLRVPPLITCGGHYVIECCFPTNRLPSLINVKTGLQKCLRTGRTSFTPHAQCAAA